MKAISTAVGTTTTKNSPANLIWSGVNENMIEISVAQMDFARRQQISIFNVRIHFGIVVWYVWHYEYSIAEGRFYL